jgi:hypothetical protein
MYKLEQLVVTYRTKLYSCVGKVGIVRVKKGVTDYGITSAWKWHIRNCCFCAPSFFLSYLRSGVMDIGGWELDVQPCSGNLSG